MKKSVIKQRLRDIRQRLTHAEMRAYQPHIIAAPDGGRPGLQEFYPDGKIPLSHQVVVNGSPVRLAIWGYLTSTDYRASRVEFVPGQEAVTNLLDGWGIALVAVRRGDLLDVTMQRVSPSLNWVGAYLEMEDSR